MQQDILNCATEFSPPVVCSGWDREMLWLNAGYIWKGHAFKEINLYQGIEKRLEIVALLGIAEKYMWVDNILYVPK